MNIIEKEGKGPLKSILMDWILPIIIALVAAILLNKFLYFKIDVPTSSMYPTIVPGDKIFVRRIYKPNKLKHGDIVVFRSTQTNQSELEEKLLIKRLIGLPGDTVTIKDGKVSINGKEIEEAYVVNKEVNPKDQEFKVPDGKYFFLGDNRPGSFDSRKWKDPFVDSKDIVAIAGLRVSPLKSFGFLK